MNLQCPNCGSDSIEKSHVKQPIQRPPGSELPKNDMVPREPTVYLQHAECQRYKVDLYVVSEGKDERVELAK